MALEKRVLTDDELASALRDLPQWSVRKRKLHRELKFGDFVEAFAFMTKVAIVAKKHDHHPEWFNVYNKVVVDLSTHEVDGISPLDVELAKQIDRFAG
jgi:4a-hydroxytetrahydrobiopterin dehydratase